MAKEATKATPISEYKVFPKPLSYMNKILKSSLHQKGQLSWYYGTTKRYTYALTPKVSEERIFSHRNIFLFATNQGPFESYLYKFNRVSFSLCLCDQRTTLLHYILNRTLTSYYHIRRPLTISLLQRFPVVFRNHFFLSKDNWNVKLLETTIICFKMFCLFRWWGRIILIKTWLTLIQNKFLVTINKVVLYHMWVIAWTI